MNAFSGSIAGLIKNVCYHVISTLSPTVRHRARDDDFEELVSGSKKHHTH